MVQPVLVLSLMLTLLLSARVERRPLSTATTFWSVLLTAFVGIVVVVGRPSPGERTPLTWEWMFAVGLGLVGLFATFACSRTRSAAFQSLSFGILCGAIFGYLAVFSKVAVDAYVRGGVAGILGAWQFWAMLVSAVLGTVVQQYSFNAGPLAQSLPAMTIFEPIVAFGLGYMVLGEKFLIDSTAGWLVLIAALGVMIAATIILSRNPVSQRS